MANEKTKKKKTKKNGVDKRPSFFKGLQTKNDAMWKQFYDPSTKIANKGKWYAIAPLVIIVIGALLLCVPSIGFNLGLDFTGGSVIEATNLANDSAVADAKSSVGAYLSGNGIKYEITTPRSTSGALGISIKYQIKRGADMTAIGDGIVDEILLASPAADIKEAESISASASSERILMTFISVAVSVIAILVYMLFRFKFTSGISAVIGLIHDVLVMIALCVIFRVQINYPFVAALITVVVYSLNNTIVLFDRVRSKEKAAASLGKTQLCEQVVDEAVKETFGRTMATTITTLVPVIALCCIGVPLIREFTLPILFGLIAGTLSTVFVTTSLYVRFENHRKFSKRKQEKLKRQENLVSPQ